jgi:hypothetical protein
MNSMRKYAILDNNTVVEILDLEDEGYLHEASYHQALIDIQDLVVQPQIGWVLTGNQLAPSPGQMVTLNTMIKSRIKYYQDQASELLRDLYAQNTMLGITVQQSDQMFTDYQDVLHRIREGAWPTAVYRLSQKEPSGFVTQEMLDAWQSLIQSKII